MAENCFSHWSVAADLHVLGETIYEEAFLPDTLIIYRKVHLLIHLLKRGVLTYFISNTEFKEVLNI